MRENLKVSVLTGSIAPYLLPLFGDLRDLVNDLRIFVSTRVERDRDWKSDWSDLPVRVQRSWTYAVQRNYGGGVREDIWRHIPYDTLALLIAERPQVVISTELGFRTMQAAVYRKLFPKSRLIVWNGFSEHTEKAVPAWKTLQRRVLYRAADAASANGQSAINYLARLGVPREKIFRLPYCANVVRHLELPLARQERTSRRLLYVGQLIERKGLVPFLKALSDWLQKHPQDTRELWIVGDGRLRAELERFPVPAHLRLRFLGSVAYDKLPELYGEGGILVFPTLADEWGVVVNEALAAGIPVLGSLYSQAVEELIREGETGWTFHPDRPDEVQRAVERALTSPMSALEAMRGKCRQAVGQLTPTFGANQLLKAIRFVRTGAWGHSVQALPLGPTAA